MGGKVWLCLLMLLTPVLHPSAAMADKPQSTSAGAPPPPRTEDKGNKPTKDSGIEASQETQQSGVGRRAIDAHAQKSLVDRIKNCCKDTQK